MAWYSLLRSYPVLSLLGVTGAAYLRNRRLMRLRAKTLFEQTASQELLLEWQARYGYNAHGLVSISPDAQLWRDPQGRGAVCYQDIGRTWLVAGDPFAAESDISAVAMGFIKAAQREGKLPGFVPVTQRMAELGAGLGLDVVPIGVAPYFDLQIWGPRGDHAKKARSGVNQARRAGVRVEIAYGESVSEVELAELCNEWLNTRRSIKFGWLFALDPLRFKERKRFFIARDKDDRMIGLLAASPIPMREGWYLEDILRRPDAPNGTSDLLIVEAMAALAQSGWRIATLGTVPAAKLELGMHLSRGNHLILDHTLGWMARNMDALYNFQGLMRFKSKFAPTWWEPEYALFPPGATHSTRIGTAVARAVAQGGILKAIWNSSW